MENCIRCKKEFDPSMEFIEDESTMQILDGFLDFSYSNIYYCEKCLYDLYSKLSEVFTEWEEEV